MSNLFQSPTSVFRGLPKRLKICFIRSHGSRTYADTSKSDSKKSVVKKIQGTETEQRLRVRLARPADVPRVLRYVRDQARVWPGSLAPNSSLVLTDYVARALAQGHSMVAEHQPHSSRPEVRGLALGAAVCPWDARLLERWARCVRCTRSRRLLLFTAHCLRAPKLHDKYDVQNILQVILIVPPDTPRSAEIVQVLAKNAIKRGKDIGFPLVRFDVNKDSVAKSLEELHLKKEWYLTYDIVPDSQMGNTQENKDDTNRDNNKYNRISGNFIAVYSKSL